MKEIAVNKFLCTLMLAGLAWLALGESASLFAAVKAFDSASDAAYAAPAPPEEPGAWKGTYAGDPPLDENPPGMDNGGFGFQPWKFDGGYYVLGEPYDNLNHFIDGVDFPTTAFNNLAGPTFGLGNVDLGYAAYITSVAARPFAATMAVGDVFSADFDTPAEYVDLSPDDFGVAGYPFAIIGFHGANGDETFNIEAGSSSEFGDFPWRHDDATGDNIDYGAAAGVGSIAPTATSDGSSLRLEVLSATTGRFTFDGVTLDLQFQNGPPAGVFFVLFDNDADDLGNGNPTGEHAFYFNNLKIESPSTPGDFDGDGDVDGADLTQWKGDFGLNNMSDGDGDGDSDGADFLIWQSNVGTGGTVGAAAAVPEAATLALAALAAMGCVGLQRALGPSCDVARSR
jgi:hypothetical protein